jgi:hypothetical protein
MFHLGGQGASYNGPSLVFLLFALRLIQFPHKTTFTPPPSNISKTRQWTIGPIYYASLAVSEFLASSNNNSQIVDLSANGKISNFTPVYAVYEGGKPMKVGIFNYMDDASGKADIVVNIAVDGGNLSNVKVR